MARDASSPPRLVNNAMDVSKDVTAHYMTLLFSTTSSNNGDGSCMTSSSAIEKRIRTMNVLCALGALAYKISPLAPLPSLYYSISFVL